MDNEVRILRVGGSAGAYTTINEALAVAEPGDEVLVAPGIYRETVTPVRSGVEGAPIRIRSEVRHAAIVRGSEILCPAEPGVREIELALRARNPFGEPLNGSRVGGVCGQVFQGGHMLREVPDPEEVRRLPGSWCALAGGEKLLVHAFEGPRADLEVSLRDRLFAPKARGMGWIEVEGMVFERCANQSAASFWEADKRQCGAVGLRAGHHITLRSCIIRDAKTIGIDMGVEGGKDVVDDHEPHDNLLEDCVISGNGEVGACGRLSRRTVVRGCLIEGNACLSLSTVEEAGLKFHQFFDGLIEGNIVRGNGAAGIWLDAVWEGARVTRNLVVNNVGSGIFMELGVKGTVDHNIVAATLMGDGIYSHDASEVLIAHNLLFANSHFGVYMRYVTDRPFPQGDLGEAPARCSGNWVLNNLFIDNYRGHICLPAEGPRSSGNISDGNHLINGTQWQWEGLGFHRFCLGDNDGDLPADEVRAQAGLSEERWSQNQYLTLEEWRQLGYDLNSHAPQAFRITKENGAVVKGTAAFGLQDPFLSLRLSEEAVSPLTATLEGLELDYRGQKRGEMTAPGPFSSLGEGHHLIHLDPRR